MKQERKFKVIYFHVRGLKAEQFIFDQGYCQMQNLTLLQFTLVYNIISYNYGIKQKRQEQAQMQFYDSQHFLTESQFKQILTVQTLNLKNWHGDLQSLNVFEKSLKRKMAKMRKERMINCPKIVCNKLKQALFSKGKKTEQYQTQKSILIDPAPYSTFHDLNTLALQLSTIRQIRILYFSRYLNGLKRIITKCNRSDMSSSFKQAYLRQILKILKDDWHHLIQFNSQQLKQLIAVIQQIKSLLTSVNSKSRVELILKKIQLWRVINIVRERIHVSIDYGGFIVASQNFYYNR